MIESEVYSKLPTRFDMCGQVVEKPIQLTNEKISHGLGVRLYNYALGVLCEAGFDEAVKKWKPSIYTTGGNDKPSDRIYCVRWTNAKGGYVEVVGILTRSGWPSLDHGLKIGHDG